MKSLEEMYQDGTLNEVLRELSLPELKEIAREYRISIYGKSEPSREELISALISYAKI